MKDLNECGLKPRPCKHRCMNTAGSYKCYCVDGYAPQPHGSCRNAQTCYHANCQYGCEVIKGAVRCTCPSPGLRLGPDRCTCVDVNECVLGGGVCPRCRKCVNTFGSFLCKCHLGFKLVYINGRYTCVVPRYPSNNQVWEFDVELGNTARDDPGGRYLSVPELKGIMWACCSCSSGRKDTTKGIAPPSGAGQVVMIGDAHRLPWRQTLWTGCC
uniref:nephronectin-like isoform X11 n=1 Tax=Monopterus albus TaxID=43700 RepID=UPI0009B3521C|nr:nephronectin-like isoform X11 [Monopterus albus]